MSKRKLVLLLITLLILGSFGAYFVVKQRGGADIVETETGTLSGAVTEVETGLPIAGAELWLSNPNVLGREMVIITTDENGEFVKEGLAPSENYSIKIASAPGFRSEYLINTQKIFNSQANSESNLIAKISNTPDYQTNNKIVILTEKLNFSAPEIGENYFSYKIRKNAVNALSINLDPGDEENLPPSDGSFFHLEDNDYFIREKTERVNILNELTKELPEQMEKVRKIENESGWQIPEEGTIMSMIDPAITEMLNKNADEPDNNEQPTRANQQGQCTQEDLAALQQIAGSIIKDYQSLERVIAARLNKDQRTKEKYAWLLPLLYAQHKLGPFGHWTLFMKMAGDPLWKSNKILDKSVWNRKENEKYKALLYNIYWPEWAHLYNRPTFTESERIEIINTVNFMRLVDWGWDAIDPPICEDIWSILNVMMMGTGALPRAMAMGDMAKVQIVRSGEKWLLRGVNNRAFQRIISAGGKGIEIIWVEGVGLGTIHIVKSAVLGRINFIAGRTFRYSILPLLEQSRGVKAVVNSFELLVNHRVFGKYFPKDLFKDDGYYPNKIHFYNWRTETGQLIPGRQGKKGYIMMDFSSYYSPTNKQISINDSLFWQTVGTKGIEHTTIHEILHDLADRMIRSGTFREAPDIIKRGVTYSPIDEGIGDFFARKISQVNYQGLRKLSPNAAYQAEVENIAQPVFNYYLKKYPNPDEALSEMAKDYYEDGGIFKFMARIGAPPSTVEDINNLVIQNKYKELKQLIERLSQ